MLTTEEIMTGGFRGLKYEQQIQPTRNALFISRRTKTGKKKKENRRGPHNTLKSPGTRKCWQTPISCCCKTRPSVSRPQPLETSRGKRQVLCTVGAPEGWQALNLSRPTPSAPGKCQAGGGGRGGPVPQRRAQGFARWGSRKRRRRGRARPRLSPAAASGYSQGLGGPGSGARRPDSGARKGDSSLSPRGRGPRCSRCSCSRARRYMASSFSSRALRALGLPGSSSRPPPLALRFVLASSGRWVALAASAAAPSPPSPGSRKAWRKRLRFSRFSRRFSSRSRAFSSRSRAFCRSRSSRARMASRWLAARSANRSSSCCRAPPARPRQPAPPAMPPPPRAQPGRPCPRLPPLPSPPPQLPRLVAPPRMRHIGPVPTAPPALWAEGPAPRRGWLRGPAGRPGPQRRRRRGGGRRLLAWGQRGPGICAVWGVSCLLWWSCPPGPAICGQLTHNAPGERFAAQPSGRERGKACILSWVLPGASVQAWALQEPAGLALQSSATTSGYLSPYMTISKQIIVIK